MSLRLGLNDAIAALCTKRTIPNDKTSPLKFGKLEKLRLRARSWIRDREAQLIIENLHELKHLDLSSTATITNKTITALLSTENHNPIYPSTSLPNLIHLDLGATLIDDMGAIAFSQSQLLDQLEWFRLSDYSGARNPGVKELLTTPLVSNLRYLDIAKSTDDRNEGLLGTAKLFGNHLGNCEVRSDGYYFTM